ncbi:MAG: hypothetical protein ABI353_00230 [Isosphaeraceae bacterium]
MATERANDLKAFKGFLDEKLSNGGADMTLDEALARWEYENTPEDEREETIRAIQRGFDDMNAGRTVDAFEFVERMREKLQTVDKR